MRIDFNSINSSIIDNIDTVLDYFGLDYKIGRNRITLACPIHGSDNNASMNIFTDGDIKVGNYVCWTSHCEKETGLGSFNLVKFLLDKKENKKHSLDETTEFIKKLTGCEIKEISNEDVARKRFNAFVLKKQKITSATINREKVRINLNIPAEYYIKRGFSKEILMRYDIGFCSKRFDEMYLRTVVPVYNEDFKLIGKLGRSMNKQCIICDKFHDSKKQCPSNDLEKRWASKWINSQGFRTGEHFYNLWYASSFIKSCQSAILVEGCGDILRLEESGIHNGLGLFGLELTDSKLEILNKLGIMNLYLALDNDGAGQEATEKIYNQVCKYFNTSIVKIGEKDIGETPINKVKEIFKGITL